MKKVIGSHLTAVMLLLKSYKTLSRLSANLPSMEECGEAVMQNFNEEFHKEGDLLDPYLMRIFDVLNIPEHRILRQLCFEQFLYYLSEEWDVQQTIESVLSLKKMFEENPTKFSSIDTFMGEQG